MSDEPDFSNKIPSQEEIEEGRRGSLIIGLAIGGVALLLGFLFYFFFGHTMA